MKKKKYEPPKLIKYGDIRRLTHAAAACPTVTDAIYYMGHIIDLNTCREAFS